MSDFSDDGWPIPISVSAKKQVENVDHSESIMNNKSDTKPSFPLKDFTDPTTPHDRVLVVGKEKKKFYVYAGHLSFCSEFFRTLFTADFKEKNEGEIELKEVDADEFHLFLNALVPCNSSFITAANYLSIHSCASRFLAENVMATCKKFASDNFAILDKIELLKMAFGYGLEDLKDKLATFLLETTVTKQECADNCSAAQQGASWKHHYYKWCNQCEYFETDTSGQLYKMSFLIENEEKLSALSDEVNAFVLKVLLKK